jgi:hypothetical protein
VQERKVKSEVAMQEMRERAKGRVNRNPRLDGRRKVGLDAKRRERELENPTAAAVMGPVRRNNRNADGVTIPRIGRSAARVNDAVYGSG